MKTGRLQELFSLPRHPVRSLPAWAIVLAAFTLLWGCTVAPQPQLFPVLKTLPKPSGSSASVMLLQGSQSSPKQRLHTTPKLPGPFRTATQVYQPPTVVPKGGKPLKLNVLSMPLPAFINEVYGQLLHLNFQISQALVKRSDLVTLRVTKPITPAALYRLAKSVLHDYGVAISVQGSPPLLQFALAKATGGESAPLLVSGLTLPSVPINNRPMFQLVPLSAVSSVSIGGWLRQIYKGMSLKVQGVPDFNAVLLQGSPVVVRQAVSAIRVLDQPAMRGRYSVRIEPVFLSATELADALIKTLKAEGYSAGSTPPIGAVEVIPIRAASSVLVFSASRKLLLHVEQWAQTLDQPPRNAGNKGLYYYQVQNTDAASLGAIIAPLIGGRMSGAPGGRGNNRSSTTGAMSSSFAATPALGNRSTGTRQTPMRSRAQATQSITGTGGQRLVVDSINNSLIYQGSAQRWAQLHPVLVRLDVPPRMVLVQVTVAEVTLGNNSQFGIEWALRKAGIGGLSGKLTTIGGLGLGNSGLNYFPMSQSGQTIAVLNAFASSNKVTVLSSPALMVESGQEASINVGSKVPSLASNTLAPAQQGGNSAIIQQIQYLSTGVMMQIQPIVHSGNRLSINLTIGVSSAVPTTSSKIDSPTISDRQVKTTLSLKDGGSVLIGGLMTTNNSKGNSRVPLLGNIPLLGNLFRNNTSQRSHSELLILIVPYIISTNHQAQQITSEFIRGIHFQDKRLLHYFTPSSATTGKAPPSGSVASPPKSMSGGQEPVGPGNNLLR